MNKMEIFSRIAKEILTEFQTDEAYNVFVFGNIPDKKLINAKKSLNVTQEEDVLILFDDTAFGSAKDAMLFTTWGIRYKENGTWDVSWNELYKNGYKDSKTGLVKDHYTLLLWNKQKKEFTISKEMILHVVTIEINTMKQLVRLGTDVLGNENSTIGSYEQFLKNIQKPNKKTNDVKENDNEDTSENIEKKSTNNFCTKCGAKIKSGAGFCTKCGTKIFIKDEDNDKELVKYEVIEEDDDDVEDEAEENVDIKDLFKVTEKDTENFINTLREETEYSWHNILEMLKVKYKYLKLVRNLGSTVNLTLPVPLDLDDDEGTENDPKIIITYNKSTVELYGLLLEKASKRIPKIPGLLYNILCKNKFHGGVVIDTEYDFLVFRCRFSIRGYDPLEFDIKLKFFAEEYYELWAYVIERWTS